MKKKFLPDKTWTLFLDRDGVINHRPPGDYVKSWKEFAFLPGVLETFSVFESRFSRIIVVTNQQGIGKGLMSIENLEDIHQKMKAAIVQAGGRLDAVYYCPDLADKPLNCRKPSIFMAQKALSEFPDINPEKCLMAGDTETDLQFGRNCGMKTVYINTGGVEVDSRLFDLSFESLAGFARFLEEQDGGIGDF